MNAVQKQLGLWFLLASLAAGQANVAVTLQDVQIAHSGDDLLVQMHLSASARPSILSAENPYRLILDFPGTLTKAPERIAVNANGVRSIRVALNSSSPPITRVVIELDRSHPYALQTDANGISLVISPIVAARVGKGAPSAGATGGFIGIFRRKQDVPATAENRTPPSLPTAPPSKPPIQFPADSQAASSTTASAP